MRFPAEQEDPENNGLAKAREVLKKIHDKHPYLSLADIYVLAGYVAFEASGGPIIPFATGRQDFSEEEAREIHGPALCPFGRGRHNPNGSLLPSADLGKDPACKASAPAHEREKPTIDATRCTFQRLGLSDKETVVLIVMGHQYGRMHENISGYGGVTGADTWYAFDPAHWNVYGPGGLGYLTTYSMQASRGTWPEWINPRNGKRQFHMKMGGGVFAFLPVDMALLWDPTWKKIVLGYDSHRLDFHRDSAAAWTKLTELGCEGMLTPEATPGYERVRIEHIH
jgi:catalase (peroxidase I)